MSRIHIATSQNVVLEFETAGVGERILASLIDLVIMIVYLFIMINAFSISMMGTFYESGSFEWRYILGYIATLAPPFFYHLICEWLMKGRSVGKLALNIRVVRLDGSPPTFLDCFMRWVFRTVDGDYLLRLFFASLMQNPPIVLVLPIPTYLTGIIAIAMSKKEQRIGDMAANTTIIKMRKRASLEDTMLKVVEQNYKPVFTNVLKLNDRDINIIKDTLHIYYRNRNPRNIQLLTVKVREILDINDRMSDVRLLETVLKDYNYLANQEEGSISLSKS